MKTFFVLKHNYIKLFAVVLALIICVGTFGGCSAQTTSSTSDEAILKDNIRVQKSCISEQIKITLPDSAVIKSFSDSHGGFLGDGICYAKVLLADDLQSKNFVNSITEKWNPLPNVDDIITSAMDVNIPKVTNGYGFYRDRYFERYGEAGYTQNYTIAVLDTDTNTLYMYASDM